MKDVPHGIVLNGISILVVRHQGYSVAYLAQIGNHVCADLELGLLE